jgi:hypothetical protein
MNKYQEALDRFKVTAHNDWVDNYADLKDEEKTIQVDGTRVFEIDGKAIKTLQELVDKETPMKVTEKLDAPVSYEQYRKCPKCKDAVARMYSYCPFCGQKLDWSWEHV